MGYIYRITNIINGKAYIGETKQKDVQSRWKEHIRSITTLNGATALICAFKKYGIDNFKFEVLIICFDEDHLSYEVEYIKKYNTLKPHGYNISNGRLNTTAFNSKTFQEFLKAKRNEYNTSIVKVRSLDVSIREKMNNSEKWQNALKEKRVGGGKPHIEESKKKISESLKQYFSNNNEKRISTLNIEKHRDIMTKALGKPVEQYTLDNKYIATFPSVSFASRQTGVPKSTIKANIYGKTKKGGNYVWKYVVEEIIMNGNTD